MPSEPTRSSRTAKAFLALLTVAILGAGAFFAFKDKKADEPAVAAEKPAARPAVLSGSDSVLGLTALADSVRLRALRGDTLGLLRLMVSDTAYRRHIWPTSSAFDSTREDAYRFVLGMHKANSTKGLRRMIYDVQTAEKPLSQGKVEYDSLPVPGGTVYSLKLTGGFRIFGSALKIGDSFQVLSYSNSGSKGRTNEE